MSLRKTRRVPVWLDEQQAAAIRQRAAAAGVRTAVFIRDAALSPATETAAERRQAVVLLFALRRELAGLVLLAREGWPDDEAADLRSRAWSVTERIDVAIAMLAGEGIAA